MSLKYGVVGAGAIGGYYGGKLALAGKDVHFLLHSDYLFVKENGLKVDSVNGDFHLTNINIYNEAKSMPQCDIVLVCLKTTNNFVLKTILPYITHPDSVVILIQNGLGLEDDIAELFPDLSIAGGLAFICSNKVSPGHINHLDYGKLNIGAYGNTPKPVLQLVCDDFNATGVGTNLSDDLMLSRWQKLVWNIPYNGMSVVLNTTTDRLMEHESTRSLIYDLMHEVIKGANKCGIPVKESFADKMMELTRDMTPYAPSMKLDWDFNRTMEIEYIYSRPVQTALKAGFEMKKVSMLEQQLRFLQSTKNK